MRCENATYIDQPGCLHGQYVHENGIGHYCWGKPAPGTEYGVTPFACRGTPGRHRRDRVSGDYVIWSRLFQHWARLSTEPGNQDLFII